MRINLQIKYKIIGKSYLKYQLRGYSIKLSLSQIGIQRSLYIAFILKFLSTMMKTIEGYTYKVNQHIGKGYSSTVHKGFNDKTGEEISIKVIEMMKLQDPINQMLLQYQVSALKNLAFSSNVLHLYDVYATKNNTYIITQLCEGDLGSLLKQKKQFPYYEAVQILKQLVSGYNDIYKVGFLHRDIKPANIFYKKGVYKIGDFGFAIPANQINQHKDYNVGSPVYMPPEALKNNLYGVSCDTWALGIIFFQIIKGVVPWRAISEQKLHQKLVTQPLHTLTTGLPQIARSFLAEVLSLDPVRRMQPGQMSNWISKLAAVQIRSMSPYQPRRQNPLQEIKVIPQYQSNANSSTSYKTHSLSNNHHQNSSNPNSHGYSVANIIPLNTRKQLVNLGCNNTPTINKINFFPKIQKTENDQSLFLNKELKVPKPKDPKQAQIFATSYINYLKFIHRVIKFIGSPTKIPLEQLQQSTIRHLFKQFQRIAKVKQPQNCSELKIQNWIEFIKSQKGHSFSKKLQKYEAKYKMFHVLSSEYPPEVYKQQILSGILKLSTYLDQKQSNFSQKVLIALDYLITFYQLIQLKDRLELKEFFKASKIDQIMGGTPYNVKKQHLPQLKKKMQILGIYYSNECLKVGTPNLNNGTFNQSHSLSNFFSNKIGQNSNYAINLNQISQGINQISLQN